LKNLILIICLIVFLELIIFYIIKKYNELNWILTKKKLIDYFNLEKFNKFKKNTYNFFLGWDLKPNFKSYDQSDNNKISFSINKKGFRESNFKNKKNKIITFGDSYTFCRQVKNKDTWQEFISKNNNIFVSNFGVGNFGLDQAYLKYKLYEKKNNARYVIFGFVPETICRIQSSWKHYLEFGNLHGFKPYCSLKKNKILINKNILKKNTAFKNLETTLNKTKHLDRFYKEKFLKHLFKFPYTISFLKNLNFNVRLFYKIISNSLINTKNLNEKVFPIIMENNIKISHSLYNESYSKSLLEKLMFKINTDVIKKNKKCLFVVFPQLFDLRLNSRKNYQIFFKDLSNRLNIVDLTKNFSNKKDYTDYFINDKYGGHLNSKGNKYVANIIKRKII